MCDTLYNSLYFIEQIHGVFLSFVGYIYIWLHGSIIGMSRPLHDDRRRDSEHERITDKCTTTAMCANCLPLGLALCYFSVAYIMCAMTSFNSHWRHTSFI